VSAGQQLSDFVGYNVGVPSVSPPANAGFVGLLDFTGLPVGVPTTIPPVPIITSRMGTGQVQIDYRKIKRRRDDEDIIILLK
jgi:hypothetical protein